MFANKITAWVLIFSLLFQVCLIPLSAEESQGEAAPSLRRRTVAARTAEAAADQAQADDAKTDDSAAAPQAANQVERELSSLATTKSRSSSNPTSGEQLISARSQSTPWAEEIDILSPDDTSPILAESVFGKQGKERINLIADNVEIKAIMDHISKEYRLNLVSSALSTGNRIKSSLYDLPLETVFQVLLEQANLSYEKKHGIVYLQDMSKDQAAFFEERFFQLRDFADIEFARKLIENIATTRGGKTIINEKTRTFFIVEYKRNLNRIEKMLSDLGYLESLDPDSNVYFYHYLGYSYVDKTVVSEIVKKYATDKGKSIEDSASNRYIIFDTRRAFESMNDALSFVDVPRGQVFVDVMFVDLTDTDRKKLGIDTTIDWANGTPGADQLVTSLATDVTNFFQLRQPNHLTSLKVTGIKENSRSNILNNPKLMVMNNETATIDVTENFPYVINENNSGVISSKIMQIPIGVQLSVKPKINANREVEMEVEPIVTVLKEVKNITTKVIDTNQANQKVTETSSEFPITDERKIKTSVVVPSGRTLVLGGLIKESDRKTADTIPGLARLPLLGRLFRRDTNAEDKSQLYVFITPTIVRNAPVSSAFTKDYGPERTTYFPTGTIEQEREKMRGLSLEKADGSSIGSGLEITRTGGPLFTERAKPAVEPRGLAEATLSSTVSSTDTLTETSIERSDLSKVDFSEFVRKISRFKDMQKAEKQKAAETERQTEQRETGFQNLLERLRDDIKQEEVKSVPPQGAKTTAVALEKRVETVLPPSMTPKDDVLGERAAKVAQLLEMWSKKPVESIMKQEEVQAASGETVGTSTADSGVPVAVDSVSSQKQIKEEKKQEIKGEKTTSQPEEISAAPSFEQKIQLEMFSPLSAGEADKKKLLQPGTVKFGNGYSARTNSSAVRARPVDNKAKPVDSTVKPVDNKADSETGESEESSSQPANQPLKRRRINKETETSALPVDLSVDKAVSTASLVKAEAVVEDAIEDDWEKDFFQNGIARVLITDMEDSLMMESGSMTQTPRTQPVKQTPLPVKNNRPVLQPQQTLKPLPQNELTERTKLAERADIATQKRLERMAWQKQNAERTALEMARQTGQSTANAANVAEAAQEMKIHSDDPRTRQIFENLFAQRAEMAQPSPQREGLLAGNVRNISESSPLQQSAQVISEDMAAVTNMEAGQLAQKEPSDQNTAEHEFSSFLEAMFNTGESAKTASGDANPAVKAPERKKELLQKSEKELLDFLNRL